MVQAGRGRVEIPLDSGFYESDGAIQTRPEWPHWRSTLSNVRRLYNALNVNFHVSVIDSTAPFDCAIAVG